MSTKQLAEAQRKEGVSLTNSSYKPLENTLVIGSPQKTGLSTKSNAIVEMIIPADAIQLKNFGFQGKSKAGMTGVNSTKNGVTSRATRFRESQLAQQSTGVMTNSSIVNIVNQ